MNGPKLFLVERETATFVVIPQENVGSLVSASAALEAQRLVEELRESKLCKVIVDFHRAEYFGTYMLEILHALWRHVRAAHGQMALCGLSDIGREIVRAARFDTLWPIYATRDEAMKAVNL
ncbi:MAG: STAS domain-containing protein [Thermoguttaceae bacterium]|jgi:anti-anti-sigma factor